MKGHVNHVKQFRFLIENKRELLMGFLVQEQRDLFEPQKCPISCSMQDEQDAAGKIKDENREELADTCSSPGERKLWLELTYGVSINIQ